MSLTAANNGVLDKFVSTLHRVIVPPDEHVDRRQSIAFFCNVNGDTIVSPFETCVDQSTGAKYPPITAKEHLMSKHLASMGINADQPG